VPGCGTLEDSAALESGCGGVGLSGEAFLPGVMKAGISICLCSTSDNFYFNEITGLGLCHGDHNVQKNDVRK